VRVQSSSSDLFRGQLRDPNDGLPREPSAPIHPRSSPTTQANDGVGAHECPDTQTPSRIRCTAPRRAHRFMKLSEPSITAITSKVDVTRDPVSDDPDGAVATQMALL